MNEENLPVILTFRIDGSGITLPDLHNLYIKKNSDPFSAIFFHILNLRPFAFNFIEISSTFA